MNHRYGFLIQIISLLLLSLPCHAEVFLAQNTLTINVHGATIHDVLKTLTQQAQIKIVALEETNIGNVKISKKFWDLPLEEGIHRVLSGWNYGISRDIHTGRITTLYLVSQRIDTSRTGDPRGTSGHNPSNLDFSESQAPPTMLSQTYAAKVLQPTDNQELEEEEDIFSDEEFETLPPNLIETLERWQRNGNG